MLQLGEGQHWPVAVLSVVPLAHCVQAQQEQAVHPPLKVELQQDWGWSLALAQVVELLRQYPQAQVWQLVLSAHWQQLGTEQLGLQVLLLRVQPGMQLEQVLLATQYWQPVTLHWMMLVMFTQARQSINANPVLQTEQSGLADGQKSEIWQSGMGEQLTTHWLVLPINTEYPLAHCPHTLFCTQYTQLAMLHTQLLWVRLATQYPPTLMKLAWQLTHPTDNPEVPTTICPYCAQLVTATTPPEELVSWVHTDPTVEEFPRGGVWV